MRNYCDEAVTCGVRKDACEWLPHVLDHSVYLVYGAFQLYISCYFYLLHLFVAVVMGRKLWVLAESEI